MVEAQPRAATGNFVAGHRPHRGFWCDSERNTLGAGRVPSSPRFGRRINVAGRPGCAYRPAGAHPSRRSGRGAACADSRAAPGPSRFRTSATRRSASAAITGWPPQSRASGASSPSTTTTSAARRGPPVPSGCDGHSPARTSCGTAPGCRSSSHRWLRRTARCCTPPVHGSPSRSTRGSTGGTWPERAASDCGAHARGRRPGRAAARVDSCGPRRGGHRRPCAAATRRSRAGARAAGGALDRWAVQRAGEGAPVDEGAGRAARADGVRRARRRRASGRRRVGRHARRAEAGQRARHP